MKKTVSGILAVSLLAAALAGCNATTDNPVDSLISESQAADASIQTTDDGKISIVTTIFPEYDWVMNILGDKASDFDVKLLVDSGVDLHSYNPSVEDIAAITDSDLFVYVGGESDEWVEDLIANNADLNTVNLLEALGDSVYEEEEVEGMEEHHHDHEEIEEEDIEDRSLSEFEGSWQSLEPLLSAGELDEYVEHRAEENEQDEADTRSELEAKWACEAVQIDIEGDEITFTYADGTTVSGEYTYAGYVPVYEDDGDITGVRYQFETDSDEAPRYVQINDHGHEPSDEVAHFHIYFGDESFDALMNSSSNPYFVDASLTGEEVQASLLEGHGHEEVEYDEHVWLSLKNAEVLCEAITDEICAIDPDNADTYTANMEAYAAQLEALDAQYEEVCSSATRDTLLFADRFPFRYLVEDYGLTYYAAFSGCSAESEASFDTIIFLADKVNELDLDVILIIENGNEDIAESVRNTSEDADQEILVMDSMQSVTSADIEAGASYLDIMTSNLDVLAQALA